MAKDKTEMPPPGSQGVKFERVEDFASLYANHVRFESTVWDLKIIFGEIDTSSGTEVIKQHTAIAIPWALAKTMIYYMQLNVMIQETVNGSLLIPPSQIPPPVPALAPEQKNDPTFIKVREMAQRLREDFMAKLTAPATKS